MHCAQDPPAEPRRMGRARVKKQENGKEKTTHWAKKAKYGKKQEGTNKRCPEGLITDLGPTAPQGRHSLK